MDWDKVIGKAVGAAGVILLIISLCGPGGSQKELVKRELK